MQNEKNPHSPVPIWKLRQLDFDREAFLSPSENVTFQEPENSSLTEKAYIDIKEKIQTCKYFPGQELNEKQLNKSFPYGRTPLREAILRLRQENLIEVFPRQGMKVSSITTGDITDTLDFKKTLDIYLLSEYCSFYPKDDLLAFENNFTQKDNCNSNAILFFDQELHLFLLSLCRNKLFISTYTTLLERMFRAYSYIEKSTNFDYKILTQVDLKILQTLLAEDKELIPKVIHDNTNKLLITLLRSIHSLNK